MYVFIWYGFKLYTIRNHPHLTDVQGFIYSFQFEFYAVYLELIYMLLGIISASQDYPRTRVFNK